MGNGVIREPAVNLVKLEDGNVMKIPSRGEYCGSLSELLLNLQVLSYLWMDFFGSKISIVFRISLKVFFHKLELKLLT